MTLVRCSSQLGRTEIMAQYSSSRKHLSLGCDLWLRSAGYKWAQRNLGYMYAQCSSGRRSGCRFVQQLCNCYPPWKSDITAALAGPARETGLSQKIGYLLKSEGFRRLYSQSWNAAALWLSTYDGSPVQFWYSATPRSSRRYL